jgi:cell division protein ZapA
MDTNKVNVKIYGQEYVLSGDKPREHIMKVADYVNTKMYELTSEVKEIAISSLGVLTAVNVSDDYFDALEEANNLKRENVQLEKDGAHYIQLWEEAKKNIIDYKEDSQIILDQKKELSTTIEEQSEEIRNLRNDVKEAETKGATVSQNMVQELEKKCRDLENSFFDVQMENIQLKSELERLRKDE